MLDQDYKLSLLEEEELGEEGEEEGKTPLDPLAVEEDEEGEEGGKPAEEPGI